MDKHMNAMVKRMLSALIPASFKPFTMFPYRYHGSPYEVKVGMSESGLPFAEYRNHRVHFPAGTSLQQVEWCYRTYLEDEGLTGLGRRTKSPHCYITPDHHPDRGDIIVDVGCSEGFFSRAYAHDARRLYLFEADEKWTDPIAATFADCRERVVFTRKFVGSETAGDQVRLGDVVRGGADDVFFIKMDIEGAERAVLEASRDFLMSHKVKLSCCAYHRQDDGRYLTKLLKDMGFATRYSDGWMLPYGGRTFPFLRHGVIYAHNY